MAAGAGGRISRPGGAPLSRRGGNSPAAATAAAAAAATPAVGRAATAAAVSAQGVAGGEGAGGGGVGEADDEAETEADAAARARAARHGGASLERCYRIVVYDPGSGTTAEVRCHGPGRLARPPARPPAADRPPSAGLCGRMAV